MLRNVVVALGALTLLACNKAPEPEPSSAPKPEPSPAGTSAAAPTGPLKPKSSAPQDIAWDVPGAWQKAENPSPMRLFTYKIPKAAGDSEDAELSVSRAGGTVDMNVQRWASQFEDRKADALTRQERTINEVKVTTVEVHGTFSGSGMPGAPAAGPKKDWALLGAIAEVGSAPYFFKLTGPAKTVRAAKPDFDKMIESFRAK